MPDEEGIPAVPLPEFEQTGGVRQISFAPSSQIADISYNDDAMILTISFQRGGVYEYYNVPVTVADGFRDAPSAGRYLAAAIKGNFDYSKIG